MAHALPKLLVSPHLLSLHQPSDVSVARPTERAREQRQRDNATWKWKHNAMFWVWRELEASGTMYSATPEKQVQIAQFTDVRYSPEVLQTSTSMLHGVCQCSKCRPLWSFRCMYTSWCVYARLLRRPSHGLQSACCSVAAIQLLLITLTGTFCTPLASWSPCLLGTPCSAGPCC
jgi:hypothetical protein